MKKYMVLWVAMFFVVVCVSLYLMMETVSSNMGRAQDLDTQLIEAKISRIRSDIIKNQETIREIKEFVRTMSHGSKEAMEKLQQVLNKKDDTVQDIEDILKYKSDDNKAGKFKSARDGVVNWSSGKEVKVQGKTCSLAEAPSTKADIKMLQIYDMLKFDNPDGGAWKQGWRVTYPEGKWNKDNVLHVFVIPHTHTDPGWVKKFMDYYTGQVKPILESMVVKLEEDSRRKFMYAEMSFFSIWWESISKNMQDRVKKLIKNGQFEIVTGGWVMNDEANAHYAAMVDQMIEGNQFIQGITGVKPVSGWAIDPFGHSPTMAYLLKRAGFHNMLIQRVHYSVKKHFAKERSLEFMWRQLWDQEGSTDILCHMMPFYSYDVPHTCGPDPKICCQFDFARLPSGRYNCPWRVPPREITDANVAERTQMLIDQYQKKATLYRTNVLFAPLGDDFRYDRSDEWDKQFNNYQRMFDYLEKNPQLGVKGQFGTLSDYFNKLYELTETKSGNKPPEFPVLSGDFFTYADRDDHYWSGYYTSRPFQKHLDRVIETNLRSAEIAFTIASVHHSKHSNGRFPIGKLMERLVEARRSLGLFQHHDGITGTAKDFVVEDYGNRLLKALEDSKRIITESIAYMSMETKEDYKHQPFLFDVDEKRDSHDALPEKTVIQVKTKPSVILLYNSLSHPRQQVVKIHVSTPYIEVSGPKGEAIHSQTDPYWIEPNVMAKDHFKVSFVANLPALGVAKYMIKEISPQDNIHNTMATVSFQNVDSPDLTELPFAKGKGIGRNIELENSCIKATFSGTTGLLQSVTTKSDGKRFKSEVKFQSYGTRGGKAKSGAYLFLPDGPAKPIRNTHPVIRVVSGPIVSEVSAFLYDVQHVARLHNSPGTDGSAVDMYNLVDIRQEINFELGFKIATDITNKDREFYTDLNGYQMIKHKTLDKLPMQANFYPMPSMTYIEDEHARFSVLTAQSLGVASLKQGEIELILDRRLNQDDERGLGQGVRDNKLTPNRFRLLFESRSSTGPKDKMDGFPSLQSHISYLQLVHQIHVIPQASDGVPTTISQQSFISEPLPCDIHLVNLRSLQRSYDGDDRNSIPSKNSALLLHRLGIDCGLPNSGLLCSDTEGKILLKDLFSDTLGVKKITKSSLTLLHDEGPTSLGAPLQLNPMEIYSFRIHW